MQTLHRKGKVILMKKTAKSLPALSLVDWKDDVNLRSIRSNHMFLDSVVREYHLKDRQAVIYSNVAFDRARMVVVLGRMPCLVILPTAETRDLRISLFLAVSRAVRDFGVQTASMRNTTAAAVKRCEKRVLRRLQRRAAKTS